MSDKEIPKAPINLRLYSWFRGLISPQHTLRYMSLESLIIGALTVGLMYTFGTRKILVIALTGLAFISIPLIMFSTTEPSKRNYPSRTMDLSSVIYFLIGSAFSAGIVGYGHFYEETVLPIHISGSVVILTYIFSIIFRSRKYKGERDYFTDQYSDANKDWERASIALENALDAREDNTRQSYYWAKRAESIYESIIEDEERIVQQEAASAFSVACGFVAASVFTKSNESYSLWQAAEQSIDRAMDFLSVRVCDECGRKKPVENCTANINDDGDRRIICQECVQRRESKKRQRAKQKRASKKNRTSEKSQKTKTSTDSSTSSKNKSKRDSSGSPNQRSSKGSSSGTSSTGSNKKSRGSTRNASSEDKSKDKDSSYSSPTPSGSSLSVEEALNVLGLDEIPNDTEKVHSAFRKKVKESHPDMGGSQEKFKKVKKAREMIVNQV